MSKKPIEPEIAFRPDSNRKQPPIDKNVQVPHQVRRAAALANALSTGQPVAPISEPKRSRSEPTVALTDAEMDDALQYLDGVDLQVTDPRFATIIELARQGARLVKAHRSGARQPRKKSDRVMRRMEAILQAYRELSPKRQAQPTGTLTISALRRSVIAKLGLQDNDDVISEDTIKKDIEQFRPLLRLVREGVIPPAGKAIQKQKTISEKTRQEMEAGKRAIAKAAAARKPHKPPAR